MQTNTNYGHTNIIPVVDGGSAIRNHHHRHQHERDGDPPLT